MLISLPLKVAVDEILLVQFVGRMIYALSIYLWDVWYMHWAYISLEVEIWHYAGEIFS